MLIRAFAALMEVMGWSAASSARGLTAGKRGRLVPSYTAGTRLRGTFATLSGAKKGGKTSQEISLGVGHFAQLLHDLIVTRS